MHGLRQELIDSQATQLGLVPEKLLLPDMPDNATYERLMGRKLLALKKQGFQISVFGDIFLEGLRQYRENQLDGSGINAVFPLWKKNTAEIAHDFINKGFQAVVISADEKYFGPETLGVEYDADFVAGLPAGVDPCGENGEFHTFVYDGPLFNNPVKFKEGEVVRKTYPSPMGEDSVLGFWLLDLLPA